MSNLIYLPGFNSGPKSEKAQYLSMKFPDTLTLDYDSWNPDNSFSQILESISPHGSKRIILLGSSLGGFWAYHFARRFHCPCVLINPCMSPEITLKPFIGEVKKMYSDEKGMLKKDHLDRYEHYRRESSDLPMPNHLVVIHEQGDELIPFAESVRNFPPPTKLITPEGGEHRFTHMSMLIDEISALL